MQNAEIRIECLKLAHRHDLSPDEVTARAAKYADWISSEPVNPTTLQGPDDTPKVEKNSGPGNKQISPSTGAKR